MPDDYVGGDDILHLLEKSAKIRAYKYTYIVSLRDTINEEAGKMACKR